uniref:Uncharacterized protein n=1 Tax=Nelumbo nucifera TaxID=4432 RepID=A0A822YWF3_NELNU|nr:TPA_asm: hypothetical protein HUJ06_006491 [Nelumbo nucifera]
MIPSSNISRLRYLTSSIETLSHRFLQRCSVSGTAKGKAKIKAGKPLKRSKIPKKKGTSGGGGRMNEATERLNRMVDSYLNAPMPI